MCEDFLSFFVSPEQTGLVSSLLFSQCVLAFGNLSKRVIVHRTSPDPGPGPAEQHAPRLQGWLQQRFTWRHTQLRTKPTGFSQTERWGVAVRAMQGQARERKMQTCWWICCSSVRVCVNAETFYLRTCETADPVLCARVPNVYVNAIMLCLSRQWEAVHCSWA